MTTKELSILNDFRLNYGFETIEELKTLTNTNIFESLSDIGECITDILKIEDIEEIFIHADTIRKFEILYNYINE